MRLLRNVVAALVAGAVVFLLGPPAAVATDRTVPGLPVYLALGDSWTAGEGATNPATEGYVPQLLQILQTSWDCSPSRSGISGNGCKHLQLVNLGRSASPGHPAGVTTPLVAAEQLPVALPLLTSRNGDANPRNDVELITLHVGGNDVTEPVAAACLAEFTTSCVTVIQAELRQFESDYRAVLGKLRKAAGPGTRIVVGTYDNPVPFCDLNRIAGAARLAAILLEGGAPPLVNEGLNDIIRTVSAEYDAQAADVYGHLDEREDWVGGGDCLHPTDPGYDKITAAFASVILG